MALSPDGKTLVVSNDGQSTQSLMVIDRATGTVLQTIPYKAPEALFVGVAFSPDGSRVYASAGGNNKIRVYTVDGQRLTEITPLELPKQIDGKVINLYPAGLVVSADGSKLYVADNLGDRASVIDLMSGNVLANIPVGHNPYTVVLSLDGKSAYVSNWGENTVSVIDTATLKVTKTIGVDTHPSAMTLNPVYSELYVANSDSDTVSVIDTATNTVVRRIDLAPYPGAKEGSSPNALTVSQDGRILYVANATNNDVAVIHRQQEGSHKDKVVALIPTAWYPTGLVLSPDGDRLYVLNAKGLGAGPNPNGPDPNKNPSAPPDQYVGSMIQGSLSIVDVSDDIQLQKYTVQVIQNNGFDEGSKVRLAGTPNEHVIPLRPGDATPIKHVIYIIKENRTYDQVLGSLGKGNGDPRLNLFGDESAPNQRELARRFVTLDNFYADAEVSADGWNWATGALANTYVQKNWPADYSDAPGRDRPYDFEGGNYATSPGNDPTDAFIWNKLDDAHIDFRNYGFRVFGGQVATTEPRLAAKTDPNFNGYDLTKPDAYSELLGSTQPTRIAEWLKEFNHYEAQGNLPAVEFVRLPNDHTAGTRVGAPTPRAYVADNDWALGQLVDAVSHSKDWGSTAIFVVEDDAQDGPDHVDAHRTIVQVISPYTQTGKVDSTFYSQVSMLRTMELIVGLGPMTQYDAAATPMLNSFSDTRNLSPYMAIKPDQNILAEKNGPNAPLASKANTLDFSSQDRAPEQLLNQMIWQSVRGQDSQMPTPSTGFREVDIPGDGG
jgi:YVTN family beta-propeller protein